MATFSSSGFSIAYDDIGAPGTGRPMVLVHGFTSNRAENWRRLGWYGALERRYRYLLVDQPVRPGLNRHHVGWIHQALDIDSMRAAALHLLGEHDFSAFRSSECQAVR